MSGYFKLDEGDLGSMWLHPLQNIKHNFSLYLKYGAVLTLFSLSILIVACSTNGSNQGDTSTPAATITIQIGNFNGSPTPPLKEYSCGAWATNTTIGYKTATMVNVFAKFVHNVDGNPEGIGGAIGKATILWPDGSTENLSSQTTADGLAVFPITIRESALNKVVLITVTFTKDGVPPCTVTGDQAAYFSLVMVSPTASATAKASVTASPSPDLTATVTPTVSPTPNVTPSVTASPTTGITPTPTKKP